jgi:hypothetical protein
MRNSSHLGPDTGRARLLGGILAVVGTAALAMRLSDWSREGHFPRSGFALPLGAFVLALAHLLAPADRRVYQIASALFVLVMIVDLLISALGR